MSPRGRRRLARGRKAFNDSEWQAGGKGKLETRKKVKAPTLAGPARMGHPFRKKKSSCSVASRKAVRDANDANWGLGLLFVDPGAANGSDDDADKQNETDSESEAPRGHVGGDAVCVWNCVGEEPVGNPSKGGSLGSRAKTRPSYGVQPNHANSRHEGRNDEKGNGARTHLTAEGFHIRVPSGGKHNAV